MYVYKRFDPEEGQLGLTVQVFAIFSCSKVVTAIAIMHLVENGGLDLDDPVSKYIPAFSDMDIITDSTETSVQTRKAKCAVIACG